MFLPKGAKYLETIRNHQETYWETLQKPLSLRKPLGTKMWGLQESSRTQIQERRRSQQIGHVPRHLMGTITKTITTRETIRNQKSGAPRMCRGPNTGNEGVSRCQNFAPTS